MVGEKILVIVGTRPEIIKMSPVIKECESRGADFFILHTGQHYTYNMDRLIYEELGLPEPKYTLGIKSKSPMLQGDHTGRMLIRIEKIILKEKPSHVVVEGDTNTVLAGSICASKLKTSPINMDIKLGHVEAGLRSFDRSMTEELNRIISDHLSDFLFLPTDGSKKNVMKEGISEDKMHVTGNTIVDAVLQNIGAAEKKSVLSDYGMKKKGYVLVTAHRQENVDNRKKLSDILHGIEKIHDAANLDVIYPLHPRTKKMMESFGIAMPKCVSVTEPLGFLEMLQLEKNARLIVTDSGGLQEEGCVLGVPSVTVRDSTERPETVEAGANIVAGTEPDKILKSAMAMIQKKPNWKNPFGSGDAGKKIVDILLNN